MFPVLTIIVAFLIGLSYPQVVTADHEPDLVGCALMLLFVGAASAVLYRRAVLAASAEGAPAAAILLRTAQVVRLGILTAYSFVVYGFDWPAILPATGLGSVPLAGEAVVLLPFALMLLLFHLTAYRAEARLGLHEFTLRSYLAFQGRQYLLPVAPLVLYILILDLVRLGVDAGIDWVAELSILTSAYPFALWLLVAAILLVAWCALPFLMRWIWRLRPLPPGPLRDRLEEFSAREGFRARDIMVMPTGGNIMNAAVLGIAGPFRYVLLTDALIEGLGPEEVEAVFAHEAGHAKHNHMLLYFLFTLGYALLGIMLGNRAMEGLAAFFGNQEMVLLLFGIGGLLLWFGILFGFVSRRFEQQADVYGALATSRVRGGAGEDPSAHPFVRALERLALQMGDIREVKGWRHFSLGERIDFLRRFLGSDEVRRRYRRGMTALLVFFFGLLAAIGVAAAATVPMQMREGRLKASLLRAQWLRMQGRDWEAAAEYASGTNLRDLARDLRQAVESGQLPPRERAKAMFHLAALYHALGRLGAARDTIQDALMQYGDRPLYLLLLGEILLEEGRRGGARLAFEDALSRLPEDDPLVPAVRARLEAAERGS